MTTEWTAARLDALPEGTLVENQTRGRQWVLDDGSWWEVGSATYAASAYLLTIPGRLRVVSVPVDALLAYAEGFGGGSTAEFVIRAAVAHVAGESS